MDNENKAINTSKVSAVLSCLHREGKDHGHRNNPDHDNNKHQTIAFTEGKDNELLYSMV